MDFNIFGGGGDRPPAPEMATPEDVEQYNLEFAREHGLTSSSGKQTDPEEAPFAKAHDGSLGRNVKNRADFPWLYDPSRGVRWDFDPIQLRNLGQANTWVGMLVQSITKEIAETPWTITEANGAVETRKRLATHPEERDPISKADAPDELPDATAERIYRLLSKPNPDLTWHDMVEQWMADLLEVGSMATVKAFHRSAYDGDELAADPETIEPRALQVTAPEVWTKDYHDRTGIVEGYWQFDDHHSPGSGSTDAPTSTSWGGTQPAFFDAAEMVWSDMSPRSNRRYGMPPTLLVEDFLQSIDLAVTQEQQYLSRGSIPSGAWVFEEWDRQQVKEWKEENAENVKGKPHKSLMFAGRGGDVKFEPMSMNFSELEFTERMKWYARVVASAFQVPTAVVGIEPERVNYNTFQGERQNFESNTLGPYLQKLERIINHDLIAPHWGEGYRFEFKPGMSESTRKMISERVGREFSSGLIRRNEARKELGRPPVDDEFNGFQDEVVEDTAPDEDGALGDLALALDKATGTAVEFPNAGGPAFESRTTLIDFCDDLAEVCDGGVFVGENEYPGEMAGELDGQPVRAVGVGERKAYAVWSRYRDEAVALSDPHTVDGASEIQQDSGGDSGNVSQAVRKQEIPDNAYSIDDPAECGGSVVQGPQGGTYCVPDGDDSLEVPEGEGEPVEGYDNVSVHETDSGPVFSKKMERLEDYPYSHPDEHEAEANRSVAAASVLDTLGANVPEHQYDEDQQVLAVEGVEGEEVVQADGTVAENVDEESAQRSLVGGFLVGDTDLHGGNFIAEEETGEVYQIDLGLAGRDTAQDYEHLNTSLENAETVYEQLGLEFDQEEFLNEVQMAAERLDTDEIRSNLEAEGTPDHWIDSIVGNIESAQDGEFQTEDPFGDGADDAFDEGAFEFSASKSAGVRKDEPLRETDDWHEFAVQPGMVEDLTDQIADDVRALFDAVLEDDEVMDIIDRLAADEETEKSLSSLGRRLREIFEDSDVVARIRRALRDETADAAREAIEDAVAETDEDPDVDIDAIESQLRDREVEFADKFADEMSEDIRETVGDGWAEGKGTREIADDIAEQADINEGWTGAERIARQELHIATGHARSEFAAEIDKVEIWNTSGDRRVRPAHEAMDGTWKRPGDNWVVDYSAEGRGVKKESVPGDSEPGIGCRCGVLLRDRDGADRSDYAGDGSP